MQHVCPLQWTPGLYLYIFFVVYNPEDPADAEILLSFLDDDELEKECEKVLQRIEQYSDMEDLSSDESDTEKENPLPYTYVRRKADNIHDPCTSTSTIPNMQNISETQQDYSKRSDLTPKSKIKWQKKLYCSQTD